jgi:transposase
MWTNENRRRYDRSKLRYPGDLTDEEWALIAPIIPLVKRGGGKRTVSIRQGNRFRLTAVLHSKMCGSVIPARLLGFGSRPWRRVRCWITFRR